MEAKNWFFNYHLLFVQPTALFDFLISNLSPIYHLMAQFNLLIKPFCYITFLYHLGNLANQQRQNISEAYQRPNQSLCCILSDVMNASYVLSDLMNGVMCLEGTDRFNMDSNEWIVEGK